MDLNIYNNLRLEYSVGANVIILSLIDTTIDKSILTSENVSKIYIEYGYGETKLSCEKLLSFHINSIMIILKDLPADSDIFINPFILICEDNGHIKYKIRLSNTIFEHTLPYGNISYRAISTGRTTEDNLVKTKIAEIVDYINQMGAYVNVTYDDYAQYAKTIPIIYDSGQQTAAAYYYKYSPSSVDDRHGLVMTSGGVYAKNDTFFHELRHRYGITNRSSHLTRDKFEGRSNLYSYIEEKFSVVHNAQKFESGRDNAKIWVFRAHSNILEGDYTNEGDFNYFAANFIKALIWYTCHSTEDEDTSKIRCSTNINARLDWERETSEPTLIIKEEKFSAVTNKIIKLGKYDYLCQYYKNDVNYTDDIVNNFIILRNFDITNDIIYDKDIFFVDKNTYNDFINKEDNEENPLCFPIYKNNKVSFSDSQELFSIYKFKDLKDISYEIYQGEDEQHNPIEANIKCDKIRIYNPIIKKDLEFIIYIDNYINNIHFHYICKKDSCFIKKCEEELKIGNSSFIEYIEFKIPSISNLFNNEYYIIDNYNNIINTTAKSVNDYFDDKRNTSNDINTNKMYLDKFILPYLIKDNNKIFIDNDSFNYNLNYINKNIIKITLYPYSGVNNNLYINSDINPTTVFINHDNYLRLHSELGFDNHTISILNTFEFPDKLVAENNYYDIDIYGEYNEFNDKYYNQVTEFYNTYYLNDNIEYLKDHEELDEELDVENIRTTGYLIQIADDIDFKNIIFESVINTDNNQDNFIYDFSFSLDRLVQSWTQLNEILVIRSKFIDKRLNIAITGNNVVLTKEWFKYLINDIDINYVSFKKQNNLQKVQFMETNQGYNFIDKINCIITDNSKEKEITQIQNQNIQIIYKPIFYKANDVQNIKIKENVIQNIGINLSDFMTKIKLFILNINGINIKESSRNDIYVIFKVNASIIEDYSGTYNILDENFEYISSGNYTLY